MDSFTIYYCNCSIYAVFIYLIIRCSRYTWINCELVIRFLIYALWIPCTFNFTWESHVEYSNEYFNIRMHLSLFIDTILSLILHPYFIISISATLFIPIEKTRSVCEKDDRYDTESFAEFMKIFKTTRERKGEITLSRYYVLQLTIRYLIASCYGTYVNTQF